MSLGTERRWTRWARSIAFVLGAACRDGPCIAVPGCPPPTASTVSVTSLATKLPVNGVTITINGDASHPVMCDSICLLAEPAGKYALDISAPGYMTVQRTIAVTSTTQRLNVYGPSGFEGKSCDCDVVTGQHLDVTLSPASGARAQQIDPPHPQTR